MPALSVRHLILEARCRLREVVVHQEPVTVQVAVRVSGLATGYWMNRLGYRVAVIEVASVPRNGGTPVDIEGETIGVLGRMGMVDRESW
jgi:hypothetical protein